MLTFASQMSRLLLSVDAFSEASYMICSSLRAIVLLILLISGYIDSSLGE